MPIITVEGPKIEDIERKRELVKRLTDTVVEIYGIKHVIVLIRENALENMAANGRLIADRIKE